LGDDCDFHTWEVIVPLPSSEGIMTIVVVLVCPENGASIAENANFFWPIAVDPGNKNPDIINAAVIIDLIDLLSKWV